MTLRVLLPLLVSASFLSLGCGGDVEASCKDYCAEANKCEGIEIDCDEQCAEVAEVADRIGCEGETSSFYSCAMEQDVCDPSGNQLDACESEFADVLSCTLDYCSDNPSDEVCGFPESGGDPPEG